MKKTTLILFLIIIIFSNLTHAQCIEPKAGMEIESDAVFCPRNYTIEDKITINKNNITIDCNNAKIIGNLLGYAFHLNEKSNVKIKNCYIENFEIGIYLEKSSNNLISNNNFKNNKFGIGLLSSENNDITNNNFEDNIQDTFVYTAEEKETTEEEKTEKETPLEEETKPSNKEILLQAFKLKKQLDEEEAEKEVDNILNKYAPITNENLVIKRNFEYNPEDGTTTVTLSITPKKKIHNVSLYEHIPKCFSTYLSDIVFLDENFEIIKEDPLIMWHFQILAEEKSFSYKINKKISEKCKELFVMAGIATDFEDFEKKTSKSKLIFPLIVTLFIIIIIVYFGRFKK